jgi:hypothetical protein
MRSTKMWCWLVQPPSKQLQRTVMDKVPRQKEDYSVRGPLYGRYFRSEGVEHGGCTLLWFKDGRADCLEIGCLWKLFPDESR